MNGNRIELYFRSIIAISTAIDLLITIYFLSEGINTVFQNIYYFTIVLAAYRYRWRGAYFSVVLSVSYLLMFAFFYPESGKMIEAVVRMTIFIIIGFVVAFLSNELNKEKRRYQAIFSASGSGMIVIIGKDRTISESNLKSSELFGEELVLKNRIDTYFESNDLDKAIESLDNGEEQRGIEMVMTLKTGEKRDCIVTIGRLNPDEFVLSISDITDRKHIEKEREVVHAIGAAINTNASLDEILHVIHENIKKVMYAENCYIALWDASTGIMSFPFFVDQFDPKLVARANHRGLTEYVLRTARPLLLNPESLKELVRQDEIQIIGTPPESWLGVPLSFQSITIGVLVVQSYEPENNYTDIEKDTLVTIGNQVAVVIERKLMEEALKQSEEHIRLLLNSAAEGIYGVDIAGICTFCNSSCLHQLGYEHLDELVGKNMHWLIHAKYPDGTDLPIEECRMFQALKMGEGVHVDDEVFWRSDGTSFPVEYWSYPQFQNGVVVGAVLSFLDVTERKKVEHQVIERMKELQAFFGLAEITERKGITIDELYQELTNILPKSWQYPEIASARIVIGDREFRTENFKESAWKQSAPFKAFDAVIGNVEVAYLEERAELDEGPFMKEERLLINAIAERIGHITERMRIEEALRIANNKLGIMNTITRHDITNQIMVANGFIELCKQREKDPDLAKYLNKISWAAANVKEQIAFSKDYQELGIRAPVWVSLGDDTVNSFAMLHPSGVVLDDATNGVEVLADRLVEKVPYNLIENSIRHGGHVTSIKIGAEQVGDSLLIVYEDDGVGISSEDRKHLFEKGFGKNTGYGLFLMREILAITGIKIMENGQPGKGVRFEMLVPPGVWRQPKSPKP